MAQIKFIPILPVGAIFDIVGLADAMEDAMQIEMEEIEEMFEDISGGFVETFVIYNNKISAGVNLVGRIWTDEDLMSYLNFGTRERWAVMSPDWSSKTAPNFIGAGPGNGRVVVRGKRAMMAKGIRPRAGIKARNWDKAIAKARKPIFRATMQDAIDKAL